jgi:ferredoxin
MKRRTLHDEKHNEDFFYESDNGRVWHEVEPEESADSQDNPDGEEVAGDCLHACLELPTVLDNNTSIGTNQVDREEREEDEWTDEDDLNHCPRRP